MTGSRARPQSGSPREASARRPAATPGRWLAAAVLLAAAVGCAPAARVPQGRVAPPLPQVDLVGRNSDLSAFKGRGGLIVFWAPWSPLSADQLQAAEQAAARFAPPLPVLGVALDPSFGERARAVVGDSHVRFPNLIGTPATADAWGGLPVVPVLARLDGALVVRGWHEGYLPADRLEAWLR